MPTPRWLLLGIFDWRSGLPYSVVNETLDFVGPRNSLRFPAYVRLEVGLERRFKISSSSRGSACACATRSTRSCRPTCRRTSGPRRSVVLQLGVPPVRFAHSRKRFATILNATRKARSHEVSSQWIFFRVFEFSWLQFHLTSRHEATRRPVVPTRHLHGTRCCGDAQRVSDILGQDDGPSDSRNRWNPGLPRLSALSAANTSRFNPVRVRRTAPRASGAYRAIGT